jgi:hypothetical protein
MILVTLALSAIAAPPAAGKTNDMVLVCYLRDSNVERIVSGPTAVPFGPHKLVVVQLPRSEFADGKQVKLHDPNGTFEGRSIKAIEPRDGGTAMVTEDGPSGRMSMTVEKPMPGDSVRKAFISTANGTKVDKMLVGHCTKDPKHNANAAFRRWQSKPSVIKP